MSPSVEYALSENVEFDDEYCEVHVYSEVEKGTSVKMYLPRLLETPGVVAREKNKKPLSKGRGETILVLEDGMSFIEKPFSIGKLAAKVRELLSSI